MSELIKDQHPVLAAITGRRSVRAFLDKPVPREAVEEILAAASHAPSGNNTQPWRVHVLQGAAKDSLTAAIMAVRHAREQEPPAEYPYYPEAWFEPYLARRRAIGWQLYGLLGIGKGDRQAAQAWHDQNFRFFGAPVGLIFTVDRRLGLGAYLDVGMFMQNIMTAARGCGLDTCAQAAFAAYHDVIRHELQLPSEELVLCGMALGWADPDALVNRLSTDREPLETYASFVGGARSSASKETSI
ncbi:MAG TPA: nitroreductase [Aliidongia sp.]|nr:nitroreductase [Aliidongia sp.]